jgi:predicted fused transcriptional regulator/phosphomethylpyrimidine kinase
VTVPANPEFGASEHVAGALLAAAAHDPTVRGALNVATDDRLLAAAREGGHEPLEVEAGGPDSTGGRGRFAAAFTERGGVPAVAYHRGAYGVEPVTYVFGTSAVDAVDRFSELLDNL